MNAFEILVKDHREVSQMMEELKGSGANRELFLKMKEALDVHAEAEETILYPALEEFKETEDQAEHSYDEHAEVKSLLAQMNELEPTSDEFQNLLTQLQSSVEHHVAEEEGELFPKGRKVLGEAELQEMGQEIMEFKQENMSTHAAGM